MGKGSVIYDSSFDLFKEVGYLCRLCKAISGNTELVKPGGAQCLPSGAQGLGSAPKGGAWMGEAMALAWTAQRTCVPSVWVSLHTCLCLRMSTIGFPGENGLCIGMMAQRCVWVGMCVALMGGPTYPKIRSCFSKMGEGLSLRRVQNIVSTPMTNVPCRFHSDIAGGHNYLLNLRGWDQRVCAFPHPHTDVTGAGGRRRGALPGLHSPLGPVVLPQRTT